MEALVKNRRLQIEKEYLTFPGMYKLEVVWYDNSVNSREYEIIGPVKRREQGSWRIR